MTNKNSESLIDTQSSRIIKTGLKKSEVINSFFDAIFCNVDGML